MRSRVNSAQSRRSEDRNSGMSEQSSRSVYTGDIDTVDDVSQWLESLSLSEYTESFRENHVDGVLLLSLTSAELRDDLKVSNLHHRRRIIEAVEGVRNQKQGEATGSGSENAVQTADKLPEHGRILDHLSNVRTYHSWLRVAVQFLSFAIVTLRLTPNFRDTKLVSSTAFYFAVVSILAMVYAVYRYRRVGQMIDGTRLSNPTYRPDMIGTISLVTLIMCAAVLAILIIALPNPNRSRS